MNAPSKNSLGCNRHFVSVLQPKIFICQNYLLILDCSLGRLDVLRYISQLAGRCPCFVRVD